MEEGGYVKTFFDGVFLDRDMLEEEGIKYPIKLEYFKTSRDEENVGTTYGIEIVKTEYLDGNEKIETEEVNNIANNRFEQERILKILKENKVTPVALQDVIKEIL